jgi:DNA repair protein RadC
MLKGKGALSDAELIAILIGSGVEMKIGGRFK